MTFALRSDRVWSVRHAPTWLLLAASAGAVNASAFSACRRFVSHVTGSMSNLALELGVDFLVPLMGFVLGATVSGLLIDARFQRDKRPLLAAPLWVSAACIATVAVLGRAGVFGPFGESVDTVHDLAFLFVLALAMGLLNAAAAAATGLAVRATHMTGAATDLGVSLATAIYGQGEPRRRAAVTAGLRAAMLGSFCVGAAGGAFLCGPLEYLAFLVPAAAIGAGAMLSFASVGQTATPRRDVPAPDVIDAGVRPAEKAV